MRRRLAASALFGLGLVLLPANGQTRAVQKEVNGLLKDMRQPKAPDTVDGQIAAALANDPDVRIAQAKVALAEAELAKVRQATTQKVVTLHSAIAEQRKLVDLAEKKNSLSTELYKKGTLSYSELIQDQLTYTAAKNKLAAMETELNLLVGDGPKPAGSAPPPSTLIPRPADPVAPPPGPAAVAPGSIQGRVRVALDKKLKLGASGDKVTFEKALDVFKTQAGLDVPVRAEAKVNAIVTLGEELSVGAWFQLFADGTQGTVILVREYGLLVTNISLSPPDGLSVFDLWKYTAVTGDAAGK